MVGSEAKNLTEVTFSIDEGMACDIYRSCRHVSLIAQASIQSPKAFLDFLGVNGQNYSLSIITFQFEALSNASRQAGDQTARTYVPSKCSSELAPGESST